jgi:UrcA family protein
MLKLASALAAVVALSAPAVADVSSTFSFKFKYTVSDLSSPEGARRVHQQLVADASDACRLPPPSALRGIDEDCRDGLIADAVKQIGSPMLTEVHSGAVRVAGN